MSTGYLYWMSTERLSEGEMDHLREDEHGVPAEVKMSTEYLMVRSYIERPYTNSIIP